MDACIKNFSEEVSFENIAVIYNEDVSESYATARVVKEVLGSYGLVSNLVTSSKKWDEASFVITIGGDGTLLKAARIYKELPILGINLGRLGFLAQARPDEIDAAVKKLKNNDFEIQNRMMLSVFDEKITALNDIVIKGDTFSRTSRLYLFINDRPVCDYLADGLIISTPTGSTAYTLSAGGPVISPGVDAVVIVPICPHTLTARPLVIPAGETIKISSCATCSMMKLSADGQTTIDIAADEYVKIEKSKSKAKIVVLNRENNGFYSILRQKLQWGVAPER